MLSSRLGRLPVKLLPFEHSVLRELKACGVAGRKLVVAVSGGVDSMLLLAVLARLRPILRCETVVAHIHHGRAQSAAQTRFRGRALKVVEAAAQRWGLKFQTNSEKPKSILKSEEALRDFRYAELQKILNREEPSALLVLAHHLDDQIETQLMRLIRGTGATGFRAMGVCAEGRLRPFLRYSKKELLAVARELNGRSTGEQTLVGSIDDPSNKNTDPLRNWLRHKWLSALEKKWPGAEKSLARSLQNISDAINKNDSDSFVSSSQPPKFKKGFDRQQFLALNRHDKGSLLVRYVRSLKIKNYTQGHIEEILRRLDNRRADYKFSILKHEWRISTRRIQALKP